MRLTLTPKLSKKCSPHLTVPSDGENLANQWDPQLQEVLGRHVPIISKTVHPHRRVGWFDNIAKENKAKLSTVGRGVDIDQI